MATINHDPTVLAPKKLQKVLWETVTCGDVGDSFEVPTWASQGYVQAIGTFNSETLTMQGSNDGTNWFTVTDPNNNAVTFTAAGGKPIAHFPRYLRPSFSGSSGGDLDITLILRTTERL